MFLPQRKKQQQKNILIDQFQRFFQFKISTTDSLITKQNISAVFMVKSGDLETVANIELYNKINDISDSASC